VKRTRTAFISAIAIGLLAGSAVGVAAQDDETSFEPPVEVTGTIHTGGGCSQEVLGGEPTATSPEQRRFTCRSTTRMSDPRLDGTALYIYENWLYDGTDLPVFEGCAEDPECEEPSLFLESGALSIENADGAWRGRPVLNPFVGFPGYGEEAQLMVLDGEGAYEGLTAFLRVADETHGFIIDGEFPPNPENASTK
jgi:hypothetical protein